MKKLFSLGDVYVSDFIKDGQTPRAGKIPLTMCMDEESGAVRLERVTDSNLMYGKRNHVLVSRPDGVDWRNINMRIMSTALTHGAYFNPCAYTPRIEIEKLLEDIDTTLNSYESRLDSLENP